MHAHDFTFRQIESFTPNECESAFLILIILLFGPQSAFSCLCLFGLPIYYTMKLLCGRHFCPLQIISFPHRDKDAHPIFWHELWKMGADLLPRPTRIQILGTGEILYFLAPRPLIYTGESSHWEVLSRLPCTHTLCWIIAIYCCGPCA